MSSMLHSNGVNVRHLFRVFEHLKGKTARALVMVEMVTRVLVQVRVFYLWLSSHRAIIQGRAAQAARHDAQAARVHGGGLLPPGPRGALQPHLWQLAPLHHVRLFAPFSSLLTFAQVLEQVCAQAAVAQVLPPPGALGHPRARRALPQILAHRLLQGSGASQFVCVCLLTSEQ
jgi:hypothetical protein